MWRGIMYQQHICCRKVTNVCFSSSVVAIRRHAALIGNMSDTAAWSAVTPEDIRSYLYILVCRTAGGHVEYDDFLARQEQAGCKATLALLHASRVVDAAQQHIQQQLKHLQQARQTRVVGLCEALSALQSVPDSRVLFWTLCSLTGLPTQNSIRIETQTGVIFVDQCFTAFVQSYWLLQHMSELETVRMQSYLTHVPVETSLATQIQQYTSSTYAISDGDLKVYALAMQFVRDTLQTTIDTL